MLATKLGETNSQFLFGNIYSEGLFKNVGNVKSLMSFTLACTNNIRVLDRYVFLLKTKMPGTEIKYALN